MPCPSCSPNSLATAAPSSSLESSTNACWQLWPERDWKITTTLEAGDAMVCEILVVDFKVIMAFAPVFEENFFVGCLVVLLRR